MSKKTEKTIGEAIEEMVEEIIKTYRFLEGYEKTDGGHINPNVAFLDAEMAIFKAEEALRRAKEILNVEDRGLYSCQQCGFVGDAHTVVNGFCEDHRSE